MYRKLLFWRNLQDCNNDELQVQSIVKAGVEGKCLN